MALCATTALAGAVPRLCVRGARGRFRGFGPVPGVVFLSFPPSRPTCSALRVAGRPVRVSLTLARWYAIPRGLCVPRARSGCPSGSPQVSLSCVCARALAVSAPPPPWMVWRAHLAWSRHWALVGPFHVVRAPPRVLPRSLAPSGVLGGGRTGKKGTPPLPQTLAVRKQLQRKTEAPASAPTQTQLSTGDVIIVSKQDEQGSKFALTACLIEDIEETPPARFRDLQYPLWVINADLFVEYDSAGVVWKWLFHVMMLGKDVIFYGEADVVHHIGRDMQRLWRMEKDKDRTTVPFYHARLLVYSWLFSPVTSNMYQFDEHCMWIGPTSRWDKQVYLLLSAVSMPLCAQGLAHCCLRYSSPFITFIVAELCDVFRSTFRRDAEQEPRWFHASDSRAVVPRQISFGQWAY